MLTPMCFLFTGAGGLRLQFGHSTILVQKGVQKSLQGTQEEAKVLGINKMILKNRSIINCDSQFSNDFSLSRESHFGLKAKLAGFLRLRHLLILIPAGKLIPSGSCQQTDKNRNSAKNPPHWN